MTTKALYPTTKPTLNLDFANTKALDPRITFSRASTATYVDDDGLIKTIASGAARFDHDPVTGESLGLLVEEARTNLVTYSHEFNNWTANGATITTNATTSPDNTITADKFIPAASQSRPKITNNSGGSTAATGTISVFAKASEANYLVLGGSGFAAWSVAIVNLTTGAYTTNNNVYTAPTNITVLNLSNGWKRVSLVVDAETPTIGASVNGSWGFPDAGGNGTSGIFVWGFQMEVGSFPTSYIPTVASTVTRAADIASITEANFNNIFSSSNSDGTMYGKIKSLDYITLFSVSAWPWRVQKEVITAGNVNSFNGITPGSRKIALTNGNYTNNIYVNGSLFGALDPGSSSSNGAQFNIGQSDGRYSNGTIARLAYYPVRLPDAQLQALTAT